MAGYFPATLEGLVRDIGSPLNYIELGENNGIVPDYHFTSNIGLSASSTYITTADTTIPATLENEFLGDFDYTSSSVPSNTSSSHVCRSPDTTVFSDPWLEILEQPCEMFRFRYLTESQGTPHGPVMGTNSKKTKRTFPAVKLHNFNGEAVVRCWLFTVEENPGPHVHKLVTKVGQKEIKEEPHDIHVNEQNNYTASFENLVIIHAVRKECYEPYLRKKEICQSKFPMSQQFRDLSKDTKKKILADLKQEIKNMNMNIVTLYFEALIPRDGGYHKLCNVISRPIKNKKNAEYGDLKIVRSDRESGSCTGGDEVFIFVEKIARDIKIKFYEEDLIGNVIWSDYASFTPLDIHHLVAIAFRTPPYKDNYIMKNVTVKYQLERPNDTSVSNSMDFTYKPVEYRPPLKRPRVDIRELPDSTSHILNLGDPAEMRVDESLDLIWSQLHSVGEAISLSDINVDDELNALPSVIDTDGPELPPPEKKAIERKKDERLKYVECKALVEGKLILKNALAEIKSESEKKPEKNVIFSILDRKTMPNNFNVLHWAIALGLQKEFSTLLETIQTFCLQSVLNVKNSSQQTPLHIAVELGKSFFIQGLLEAGADPNQIDSNGYAPIHIASVYQPGCLQEILKSPLTEVSLKTKDGMNALHLAVKVNNIEAVKHLLENNVSVESCCSRTGDTALHLASTNSLRDMTQLLLKNNAKVNSQNYAGNTSLHFSVANNDMETTEQLLKYGADPNIRNFIKCEANLDFLDSDSDSESDETYERLHGQSAFDLASSKQMLKLLKTNFNLVLNNNLGPDENVIVSGSSGLFSENVMLKVCAILDEKKAWATIAQKLGHSSLIPSMENSPSPSKILLNCLDVLGDDEDITNLIQIMDDLNIKEAVELIKNNH